MMIRRGDPKKRNLIRIGGIFRLKMTTLAPGLRKKKKLPLLGTV